MKALLGSASVAAVLAAFLLLHGVGSSPSPLAVALANAAVRCPDGFTAKAHGLPAGSDPTATLSDSCVLDFGIPAGEKGDKGDKGGTGAQGVAGPPGLTNYGPVYATTVKSAKSNGSDRIRTEATARCPAGEKAVGGGYRINATVNGVPTTQTAAVKAIKLNSSKSNAYRNGPTADGNGWTVGAVTAVITSTRSNTFRTAPVGQIKVALIVTANCAKVS